MQGTYSVFITVCKRKNTIKIWLSAKTQYLSAFSREQIHQFTTYLLPLNEPWYASFPTPEQEERLLAFMEKDKIYSKYYDEVVLLLETGLRISEFCGLTTHIDMQNKILNIDHQLLKDSEIGYYIETPKTKNGKRELPLTERAYQAIQRILKNRGKAQPLIVGGYSNFLFLNREGLPKVAGNYEGMVRGLIKKYNKYHTDKLPNITPHSFRHTYCTNMANRGMNPNTLQYLMGHANITMTLGYYAHGTFQSAKAELERLAC